MNLASDKPLTDAELDRLEEFLAQCKSGSAMTVEELDGFFSALIAGPETVPPSEYLPEVFGSEGGEGGEFQNVEEANEILALLMRHWNSIVAELSAGEPHVPLLFEAEDGTVQGNDWAEGFMHGVTIHPGTWDEMMDSEETAAYLFPMLWFVHEHDPDETLRPVPTTKEKRDDLIAYMALGLMKSYEFFRAHRQINVDRYHAPEKVGRNEPCPCGSGKKYKRCHGNVNVQ